MNQDKSTTKKATQKAAKSATASGKRLKGFTDEERAAMQERAQELKAEARASKAKADGESALVRLMTKRYDDIGVVAIWDGHGCRFSP